MKDPQHIAIIMDGNGRWASERYHGRIFGHVRGARAARNLIIACSERRIKNLTLFTFSTENWQRPAREIDLLMALLRRQLVRELNTLLENNIRFRVIGDINSLPPNVMEVVLQTVSATAHCTGMNLVFALSYGGRQEITQTVQKMALQVASGQLKADQINEELISGALESAFLPNPDLIIRTSGEHRLSNFFLWQAAYSELYITDKLWPDFKEADLDLALKWYSRRERRFGKITIAPEEIHLFN